MDTSVAVPRDQPLFRAIRSSKWVDDEKNPVDLAFLLRTDKGEKDLSLLTEANCHDEYCAAIVMNKCFGEFALVAEVFYNLDLSVVQTDVPEVPNHASVFGLPDSEGETEALARSLAKEIAQCVSEVRLRPKPFKRSN